MAIRYIDNVTILADVGEQVTLPSFLIARHDDGSLSTVSVVWSPPIVDTSTEGEFIFVGTVNGYAHKVLCSVQVGRMEDNPSSVFPEAIDTFGLPKKDIQTADVPDIDDYQYFKAKIPRTMVEEYQLKQLREMLADKIILARDVNHMRNAIIEIEKYCHDLQDQLDELEQRVTDLERRVDILEEETVVDGRNLGRGAEVFYEKRNRMLEFRTLVGKGDAEVYEEGREIVIDVQPSEMGCGFEMNSDKYNTCGDLPSFLSSGILAFSDYFNFQMVKINGNSSPQGYWYSLLGVLGMGNNLTQMKNAVRFLKADQSFIVEIKLDDDRFVGMILDNGGGEFYDRRYSEIQNEIYDNIDVYSDDISASRYQL